MTAAVNVRSKLIDLMRRDLIGPHPDLDPDLAREVLQDEKPSRWYVGGFIVPVYDSAKPAATEDEEEASDDLLGSETLDSPSTATPTRRMLPISRRAIVSCRRRSR